MSDKKTWKTPRLLPLAREQTDGKDHRVPTEIEVTMTITISTPGGMTTFVLPGETVGPS